MSDKLFGVLSDLEGLWVELSDLSNLLTLHDEDLSSDMEPLIRGETWGGQYFLNRAPLHESMLNVIRTRLSIICKEMQVSISKGYEVHKEQRGAAQAQ